MADYYSPTVVQPDIDVPTSGEWTEIFQRLLGAEDAHIFHF